MISVEDAVARITAAFAPLSSETVPIGECAGCTLAENAIARVTQPPFAVSAMDGYALKCADAQKGATLRVIGSAPAGHPFAGKVGAGEAVRIFTGAVVPDGADTVLMQENTSADGDSVTINEAAEPNRHIRAAGLDFKTGQTLAKTGRRLTARDVALLAAGDLPTLTVRRKPIIAIAATGDELTLPGVARAPGSIVASSGYALTQMITQCGGGVLNLGIVPDNVEAIAAIAKRAKDADLIVTLGGASVGEHDLIQRALGPQGFTLDFWKIAMRPGKPLIFGRLGNTPLLGLPGNPVSTFVCALLFVKPAIAAMLGRSDTHQEHSAKLARALPANGPRQDYIRTRIISLDGEAFADPFDIQDSSMQSLLAAADALIVRAPHAPAADAGARVQILPLGN